MHACIIAHEGYRSLASAIAHHLQLPYYEVQTTHFADSEIAVTFKESGIIPQESRAFIVHSTSRPVNDTLIELLLTVQMLKSKNFAQITAIVPYFGYARQDRQNEGESVAHFVLRLLRDAGVDHLITVELHNPALAEDAPLPTTNIRLNDFLTSYLKTHEDCSQLSIIAPDEGALERVRSIAHGLNVPIAHFYKERYDVNKTRIYASDGICKTTKNIIIDDIIDTGSTLLQVVDRLQAEHPGCRLFACCIHAVLSNDARNNVQKSPLETLWVTNSISWPKGALPEKVIVIDISKEIADAVRMLL